MDEININLIWEINEKLKNNWNDINVIKHINNLI